MGNFKMVFYGTEKTATQNNELIVFANAAEEVSIKVTEEGVQTQFSDSSEEAQISLDISTAIRFSRELKRVIAELKNNSENS